MFGSDAASPPQPKSFLNQRTALLTILSIGGVLAAVGLFDLYRDWVHQGEPLWSTVLENCLPFVVAVAIASIGRWAYHQREDTLVLPTMAEATVVGGLTAGLLASLVVSIQLFQGEVKPLITGFQMAALGSLAGLIIGYQTATASQVKSTAKREQNRLARLLDGLPTPVVRGQVEYGKFIIKAVNTAFEKTFGFEEEELRGRDLNQVVVPKGQREEASTFDREALQEGHIQKVVRRQTTDGLRDFQLQVTRARKKGAREVYAIYTDITRQKRRQQELEQIQEEMELALQHTDSLLFGIDLETESVWRSGPFKDFFGVEAEEVSTLERFVEKVVHPEDRERFRQFYGDLAKGERDAGEFEYRTNPEVAPCRWIRDNVQVEETGSRQLLGLAQDVTLPKERQKELRWKERRYQAVFEDPNIFVGLLSIDGQVLDINRTALEYVDAPLDEIVDKPFWEAPWFEDDVGIQEEVRQWIRQAASGEYVEFEADLSPSVGLPLVVSGVVRPVTDETGEVTSLLISGRDITERKEREKELHAAREEAEEASRLKTAMLANMSHELRTPLTSITGFSELLKEELEEDLEAYATHIHEGSLRLKRTLESVLHLSQLEAGVGELSREHVSLRDIAQEIVEMLGKKDSEKALTIKTRFPPEPATGYWNEDAVHCICQNLVENAIKFTPEGGRIEVRVDTEGNHALLQVEDTGIGMDPENVQELFRAFRQESEGLCREYEGTGLGLSIVQRFTEELGGTVEVDTEKGEGACFTVRLPLT